MLPAQVTLTLTLTLTRTRTLTRTLTLTSPNPDQVWQVSLKTRFDFGPPDHAKLMGMVGFSYALSQGLVARPLIAFFGKDPTKLILLCISILGGCRPFALKTASVAVVYMLYVPMVSRARARGKGRVVARVRARIRVRSSRRCTCPHP